MTREPVPVVWSPRTREHVPGAEIWVGKPIDGTEVPERVDIILAALDSADFSQVEAEPHDDEHLLAVHDRDLLGFLRDAHTEWMAGPYVAEVGQDRVVPYFFPTPAMAGGLPLRQAAAVHARAGTFGYDTMTLLNAGTWPAARAAVDCALTAVDQVSAGAGLAYALCRPPGHHVTRAAYGGSCYLNNAAVAAAALRAAGHERVGIVDLDAHQGNGTASIFYERADVAYGSVHVDPAAGWFPHVVGYAEETGSGAGEGATHNLPLAEGTGDSDWLAAVEQLATWVADRGSGALVVSLGVDAAADDPESPLEVTADGYDRAGQLLAELQLPTVAVQEGGYHLETLGPLVRSYLQGHAGG